MLIVGGKRGGVLGYGESARVVINIVQMYIFKKKKKITSSCKIDQFFFLIKTQLCKPRVILRSRVLRGVYTLVKDTGR